MCFWSAGWGRLRILRLGLSRRLGRGRSFLDLGLDLDWNYYTEQLIACVKNRVREERIKLPKVDHEAELPLSLFDSRLTAGLGTAG